MKWIKWKVKENAELHNLELKIVQEFEPEELVVEFFANIKEKKKVRCRNKISKVQIKRSRKEEYMKWKLKHKNDSAATVDDDNDVIDPLGLTNETPEDFLKQFLKELA